MKEKNHKNYIIQGNYTSCAAAACQKLFGYEMTGYYRSVSTNATKAHHFGALKRVLTRLSREFPHLYRDATEKLFSHTIYSTTKYVSILYIVLFCAK